MPLLFLYIFALQLLTNYEEDIYVLQLFLMAYPTQIMEGSDNFYCYMVWYKACPADLTMELVGYTVVLFLRQ
jgi:hypothetical protein